MFVRGERQEIDDGHLCKLLLAGPLIQLGGPSGSEEGEKETNDETGLHFDGLAVKNFDMVRRCQDRIVQGRWLRKSWLFIGDDTS